MTYVPYKALTSAMRKLYPGLSMNEANDAVASASVDLRDDDRKSTGKRAGMIVRGWLRHAKTDYDSERMVCGREMAFNRAMPQVAELEASLKRAESRFP